jgi:hypothetical protein
VLSVIAWFGVSTNFRRSIFLVIFSLLLGLAAAWLGVTSISRATRAGSVRPISSVLGTVFGCITVVISTVVLIGFALFWQQLNSYSQCLNSASTVAAQQACLNQLHRSVGIGPLGSG